MEQRRKIALGIVSVYGFLFALAGLLSFVTAVVMIAGGKFPEDAPVPRFAPVLGALFTCLVGVPGILTFFLRKRPVSAKLMIASGIVLALHGLMAPFTLAGPVPITLFVLMISALGIWVLLVSRALHTSAPGEPAGPTNNTGAAGG